MKWIIRVTALFLFLGGIFFFVIISSSQFQKYAVARYLSKYGKIVKIGKISIGPHNLELSDLEFKGNAYAFSLRKLELNYSAWDYVFHDQIHINRLFVQGLEVDLSFYSQNLNEKELAAASGTPVPGLLGGIAYIHKMPSLWLKDIDVGASILINTSSSWEITLKGDGIEPGGAGKLDAKLLFEDKASSMPISKISFIGALNLAQKKRGGIESLFFESMLSIDGAFLEKPLQLKLIEKVEPIQEGERLTLSLSSPESLGSPLVEVFSESSLKTNLIRGTFRYGIPQGRLAILSNAFPVPDFSGSGAGAFEYNLENALVKVDLDAEANLSKLGSLSSELSEFPSLKVNCNLSSHYHVGPKEFSVESLSLRLNDSMGGKPILSVDALRPFMVSVQRRDKNGMPQVKADGSFLDVGLYHFSLKWIEPYLKEYGIFAGRVSNRFELKVAKSALLFEGKEPLSVLGFGYKSLGDSEIKGLSFYADLSGQLNPKKIEVSLGKIRGVYNAHHFLNGKIFLEFPYFFKNGRIEMIATSVSADTSWELEPLAGQPFLKDLQLLLKESPPRLALNFSGSFYSDRLVLEKVFAKFSDSNSKELLKLVSERSFTLEFDRVYESLPKTGEIFRLSAEKMPLEWISFLLPGVDVDGYLFANIGLSGYHNQGLRLAMGYPIGLEQFSLAINKSPVFKDLDKALVVVDCIRKNEDLIVQAFDLKMFQGKEEFFGFKSKGSLILNNNYSPNRGEFSLELDVSELLKQPLFSHSVEPPLSGNLSIQGEWDQKRSLQSKVDFRVRNWQMKEFDPVIKSVDSLLTFSRDDLGQVLLTVPFEIVSPFDETQFYIKASSRKNKEKESYHYDARLTGDFVSITDLESLVPFGVILAAPLAIFQLDSGGSLESSVSSLGKPFWSEYTGNLRVDLKKLRYKDYFISKVTGDLSLKDLEMALQDFAAQFDRGALSLNAVLGFDQSTHSYDLKNRFSLRGFDLGSFFRKTDPGKPVPVDGIYELSGNLSSSGQTVHAVIKNIQGRFDVSGGPGILKALARAEKGTKLAGTIGGAVLGVLGESRDRPGLSALSRITKKMNAIPYEKIILKAERGPDLNIKVPGFSLKSPELMLRGQGMVTYKEDTPIPSQPLSFDLNLGAQGDLASDLQALDLVSDDRSEDGYFWMPGNVRIAGTLSNPDSSRLWSLISKAATSGAFKKSSGRKEEPVDPGVEGEKPKRSKEERIVDGVVDIINIFK